MKASPNFTKSYEAVITVDRIGMIETAGLRILGKCILLGYVPAGAKCSYKHNKEKLNS